MDMMSIRRRIILSAEAEPTPQPTNLIDPSQLIDRAVWWAGSVYTGYANNCITPLIAVEPGVTYYMDRNSYNQNMCSYFDSNQQYLRQVAWASEPVTKEIPSDVYYIGITIGINYKDTAIFRKA